MALLVAGTIVVVLAVASGSWRMDPVLSGSMRPSFPVGGLVLAERVPVRSIEVGDVVLFTPPWAPGETYVHRVISLSRQRGSTTIRTKGDANPVADPAPVHLTGRWIYEARAVVPFVGYLAVWCHSPAGELELAVAALVTAIGVAGWSVGGRRGAHRASRDPRRSLPGVFGPSTEAPVVPADGRNLRQAPAAAQVTPSLRLGLSQEVEA